MTDDEVLMNDLLCRSLVETIIMRGNCGRSEYEQCVRVKDWFGCESCDIKSDFRLPHRLTEVKFPCFDLIKYWNNDKIAIKDSNQQDSLNNTSHFLAWIERTSKSKTLSTLFYVIYGCVIVIVSTHRTESLRVWCKICLTRLVTLLRVACQLLLLIITRRLIWTDFSQFLFILCTIWCEQMIDNRLYGWILWPSSSLHIKQQGVVSSKQAEADRQSVCCLLSMAERHLVTIEQNLAVKHYSLWVSGEKTTSERSECWMQM